MGQEKKEMTRLHDVDDMIYGENCEATHSER